MRGHMRGFRGGREGDGEGRTGSGPEYSVRYLSAEMRDSLYCLCALSVSVSVSSVSLGSQVNNDLSLFVDGGVPG